MEQYNIWFGVAAAGVLGLLIFYLYVEYPNATLSNKRYRELTIWLLVSDILDVITAIMIDNGAFIPRWINTLANTVFFIVSAIMVLAYIRYIDSFLMEKQVSVISHTCHWIINIYILLMVGNIFGGYCFYFDEAGRYIHGPIFPLAYLAECSVLLMGLVYLIYKQKNFEFRRKLACWIFIFLMILGSVLQVLIFTHTLLCMYMGTLAVMIFLFVVETPDYLMLQETMKALEEAKLEADQANKAKSMFLAKMSHEIRTPLNAVIGMNEMILREHPSETVKSYALDIKNAADTLLSTINDILDLSKVESGKMELVMVEYDVSSLLHDVITMMSMKAEMKGLTFALSLDEGMPSKLYGDDIRIRQILVNILNNAVKYTEKGTVTFSVKSTVTDRQATIRFVVQDTGIGMKQEDIGRLFFDYARMDQKRNRNIEGTGLGMGITKQLLTLMGSELKVESVYGEGSVFSFDLVQEIRDAEPIGNLEQRIAEREKQFRYQVAFTAPQAKILVVDDSPINRKVFMQLLKQTGVQIEEAGGGLECLSKVQEKHYDLIFLDHMMPDLDGVLTLERMKQLTDYPCKDVPVVALTANAIAGAEEMYLKTGFKAFLSKPIRTEKLEHLLIELLPAELVTKSERAESYGEEDAVSTQDLAESLQDFPKIDGVDWEYALLHLRELSVLRDTIQDFIAYSGKEKEDLARQYEIVTDAEALRLYRVRVHSMKNSAAMIGAMTVSSLAKLLEYAASANDIDRIRSLHPIFMADWEKLTEELRTHFAQPDVQTGTKEIEKEELQKQLAALRDAMQEYDVDTADAVIGELAEYGWDERQAEIYRKMADAVKNLEEEETLQAIGQMEELVLK